MDDDLQLLTGLQTRDALVTIFTTELTRLMQKDWWNITDRIIYDVNTLNDYPLYGWGDIADSVTGEASDRTKSINTVLFTEAGNTTDVYDAVVANQIAGEPSAAPEYNSLVSFGIDISDFKEMVDRPMQVIRQKQVENFLVAKGQQLTESLARKEAALSNADAKIASLEKEKGDAAKAVEMVLAG